jgi:hypothetical protein
LIRGKPWTSEILIPKSNYSSRARDFSQPIGVEDVTIIVTDDQRSLKSTKGFVARWVSITLITATLSLSGWALSSPIGSSPDDDFHLPSIWCGQGFRDDLCEEGSEEGFYEVPYTTMGNSICFAFRSDVSGVCNYDNSLIAQSRVNRGTNLYPPGFYWAISWFASTDIAISTILMRIANSIFLIGIIALTVISLPSHLRRIPIFASLVTLIPLGIFLVASTNPSSWSFIGLLVFISSTIGFLSVESKNAKIKLSALAGLGFLMAVGSRADSPPFAALAVVLAWTLTASRFRATVVNLIVTGAFFIISVFLYFSGRTASSIVSGDGLRLSEAAPGVSLRTILHTLSNIPELWFGVFGGWGLGWLDTHMLPMVRFLSVAVFIALVFLSVRWFNLQQGFAFLLASTALTLIPLYILVSNGLNVGQQVQPRYLLPLIIFVAAVAFYAKSADSGMSLSAGQSVMIGISLVISNTLALHTNMRRYLTGLDVQSLNLDSSVEWWWKDFLLSPNAVWVISSASFALFIFSIWKLRYILDLPLSLRVKNTP